MLIIFDLDDTLIDTSGVVTPFKMRECVKKLQASGVRIQDEEASFQELLRCNQEVFSSVEAICFCAQKWGASQEQMQYALKELTAPLPSDFVIPMTPYAQEVLSFYREKYPLAIVTGGYPEFQKEKLKKAGVDTSFFSMISIPEDSVKKPSYRTLQEKFSLPPEQIWVCGDRIAMDLKPAKDLGFRTVHMRWGRGAKLPSEEWIDYSISNLKELKEIIR